MTPFVVILLFVSFTSAIDLFDYTAFGYLRRHGVPAAERIREAEKTIVSPMIVGGSPTPITELPFVAGLLITFNDGLALCTSSLISANTLVTAAHCWNDGVDQAEFYTVVLGSIFLFTGGTRVNTSDVTTHPKWNPEKIHNDIAIIKLSSPVTLSSTIQPIPLSFWLMPNEDFTGFSAIAAGFGLTSDGGTIYSNQSLSSVNLTVISNLECMVSFLTYVRKTNICTSGLKGTGPCSGDSGGPLIIVTKTNEKCLVGAVSFGSSLGCESRLPTVYSRISEFQDFITAHL